MSKQAKGNQCQTPEIKFESEWKSLRIIKNQGIGKTKNNKEEPKKYEGTVIMGRNKQKQEETNKTGRNKKKKMKRRKEEEKTYSPLRCKSTIQRYFDWYILNTHSLLPMVIRTSS